MTEFRSKDGTKYTHPGHGQYQGEDSQLYIGLMSGTSLDGIDALLADFSHERPRIMARHHLPYADSLRQRLLEACRAETLSVHQLAELDVRLGRLYGRAVSELLAASGFAAAQVCAIGSHGQTIRHHPAPPLPYTLQLGDPNLIAEQTGITTVADFRRRDLAAGGQGAPLVPAFHAAVFHNPGLNRAILNLGGMANLTLLPADAGDSISGFDTGPGNVLLDDWIGLHRQQRFDLGGAWAAQGHVLPQLLQALLSDPYFDRSPPKSTGREHFNLRWLHDRLAGTEKPGDVQATLLELTAISIQRALEQHAPTTEEVLACGGGVRNVRLMERLQKALAPRRLSSTGAAGVEPQDVEALAFAWLAQQTLHGLPGNLPTVTGASRAVILGGIYPGRIEEES